MKQGISSKKLLGFYSENPPLHENPKPRDETCVRTSSVEKTSLAPNLYVLVHYFHPDF
jgi:hypothetical protein